MCPIFSIIFFQETSNEFAVLGTKNTTPESSCLHKIFSVQTNLYLIKNICFFCLKYLSCGFQNKECRSYNAVRFHMCCETTIVFVQRNLYPLVSMFLVVTSLHDVTKSSDLCQKYLFCHLGNIFPPWQARMCFSKIQQIQQVWSLFLR